MDAKHLNGKDASCAVCKQPVPHDKGAYDPLTGGVVCEQCQEDSNDED